MYDFCLDVDRFLYLRNYAFRLQQHYNSILRVFQMLNVYINQMIKLLLQQSLTSFQCILTILDSKQFSVNSIKSYINTV